MAAVEQHIQYKRELHAGDAVTVQSALLEVKDKSIHMLHKMTDDATGQVAATTVVVVFTLMRSYERRFAFLRMCGRRQCR